MPGLLSLASGNFAQYGENRSKAFLVELDKDGSADSRSWKSLAFQYFPETITDTKQTNYARLDIPGGSIPVYQWISGGERSLSFTAYFTTDVDLTLDDQYNLRIKSAGVADRNVDIRAAVAWLRQYKLPRYDLQSSTGSPMTEAPKRLLLILKRSRLGLAGGVTGEHPDHVRCIMTQCDVSWQAWFPSGFPRTATVQLSFAQIGQAGGTVVFPTAAGMDEFVHTSHLAKTKTYGYFIGADRDPTGE